MDYKVRQLHCALREIMDPERPIYVKAYKPRKDLQLYEMYIPAFNRLKYRFDLGIACLADDIMYDDVNTRTISVTDTAIRLPFEEMLKILEDTNTELYAPASAVEQYKAWEEAREKALKQFTDSV